MYPIKHRFAHRLVKLANSEPMSTMNDLSATNLDQLYSLALAWLEANCSTSRDVQVCPVSKHPIKQECGVALRKVEM